MANLAKPLNQGFAAPSIVANYGPYNTVAAAHAALAEDGLNVVGMTVGIKTGNTIEEYWYQGGTAQSNLVPKKPALAPVATSGSYNDLTNKPTIPAPVDISGKADKSEMSITPGTGANADKTTIQLKSGTSVTVLTQHQDISGKADKITTYTKTEVDNAIAAKANTADVETNLATKQDTINDLATIRSGAALGATAKQPATTIAGYGIIDAYTKQEVNNLVSTPHQQYVTVATKADLDAITTGSADTIYRVSNYDGTQVDASKYAEYAWDGTQYVLLTVKSAVDEIFDISAYTNKGYETLSAALEDVPAASKKGGMNIKFIKTDTTPNYGIVYSTSSGAVADATNIDYPFTIADGNSYEADDIISVIEDSLDRDRVETAINSLVDDGDIAIIQCEIEEAPDQYHLPTYGVWRITKNVIVKRKYVLFSLTSTSWSDVVANWQGVDEDPTAGSNNLVKSGGVYEAYNDTVHKSGAQVLTVEEKEQVKENLGVTADLSGYSIGVFNVRSCSTLPNGNIAYTNHNATPYIDVDDIAQGACVVCAVYKTGLYLRDIQCFNADKEFIGLYNSGVTGNIPAYRFFFDRSKLVNNTKYVRMSAPVGIGYIQGIDVAKYSYTANRYVDSFVPLCEKYLAGFENLQLDCNYYDYDFYTVARIPVVNTSGSIIECLTNEQFVFFGWKDGSVVKTWRIRIADGTISGHKFIYNNFNGLSLIYDFDKIGYAEDTFIYLDDTHTKLTRESFGSVDIHYKDGYEKYINYPIGDTRGIQLAKTITYLKYTSDAKRTVTFQRIPSKADVIRGTVEGGNEQNSEYFCLYEWYKDSVIARHYLYILDNEHSERIISGDSCIYKYTSKDIEFTIDLTDTTYSTYGTNTKSNYSLSDIAYHIETPAISGTRRPDLSGKKYVNLSSSTFSYAWHKSCVTALGMTYYNYGKGGASHYIPTGGDYNYHYATAGDAGDLYGGNVADRNVLNMVAKLYVDYINGDNNSTPIIPVGFYPDVIVSCCVLNDCYTGVDHIGSWAEASAVDLASTGLLSYNGTPIEEISSVSTLETMFQTFFESTDSTIVAFRNNSMKMMRLSIELLLRKFPETQIIVSSCQQIANVSFDQTLITKFNEEQEKLCKYYALPYIRLTEEVGINPVTIPTFLISDLLHPNNNGELVYKNYLTEKLIQNIALKK